MLLIVFEALSINESFQLNYSRFNSAQSKNSHNNRAFLFPIIHHFRLISFTGLNRHTETNDNYCKVKKKRKNIRVKASRPLVFFNKQYQSEYSLRYRSIIKIHWLKPELTRSNCTKNSVMQKKRSFQSKSCLFVSYLILRYTRFIFLESKTMTVTFVFWVLYNLSLWVFVRLIPNVVSEF